MSVFWQVVVGVLCGVVAGMGMGGGTFLIPILTIFFSIKQHIAQGLNLVGFVFCALFALVIHIKRKMVNFKVSLPIIFAGVLFSLLGAILSNLVNSYALQIMFGVFLLIIGLYQLVGVFFAQYKNKNDKKSIEKHEKKIYKLSIFSSKMFK